MKKFSSALWLLVPFTSLAASSAPSKASWSYECKANKKIECEAGKKGCVTENISAVEFSLSEAKAELSLFSLSFSGKPTLHLAPNGAQKGEISFLVSGKAAESKLEDIFSATGVVSPADKTFKLIVGTAVYSGTCQGK